MIIFFKNIFTLCYVLFVSPYVNNKIQYIDYESDDDEYDYDADDDEDSYQHIHHNKPCYCKNCQLYNNLFAFLHKPLKIYE